MQSLKNSLTSLKEKSQSLVSPVNNSPINSIKTNMSSFKENIVSKTPSLTGSKSPELSLISNSEEPGLMSSIFSGGIKTMLFILMIIILLAIIGFNIFTYLSEGTDFLSEILAPLTNSLAMLTGDTTKSVNENVSDGTKEIIEKTSDTGKTIVDQASKGISGGINTLQNTLQNNLKKTSDNVSKKNTIVQTENHNMLADESNDEEPEPTRSNSLQQGYCYIGKINDTRYCAKVSARELCMSGDLYPSMDICINPSLR